MVTLPSHDQGICLSAAEFDALFPFHVGFDPDGVITHAGPSLRRLAPDVTPGARLADVLRPHRPAGAFDFEEISAHAANHVYTLREPRSGALLRGQMQRIGDTLFFVGSPWLSETSALPALGLTLNDFAVHDPTLDHLMLLELQKLSAEDTQALAGRLEKNEQMLRSLFEVLPMDAVIRDQLGVVKFSNGYLARKCGMRWTDGATDADQTAWQAREAEADRVVFASGEPADFELVAHTHGRQRWFQCIKFLVPGAEGERHRICSLTHEITVQKELEGEVRNLAEQRGKYLAMQREFISMVSHEFRTPLTTIASTQYLIKKALKESGAIPGAASDRLERSLQHQESSLATLNELVDQVLILNQIDHLRTEAPLVPLAPNAILSATILSFNETAPTSRVVYRTELPEDYRAPLHESLIRAAVSNLVSNALKYSPPDAIVEVRAFPISEGWAVTVSDHGIGIPLHDQKRLFQPFFRASNVGYVPGTGLGLAIVKRAVDFHGGRVGCESASNAGANFTITFPATVAADPHHAILPFANC